MSSSKHAVIYTDAGYLHHSSSGGWGVHGYVYDESPTKSGSGCQKAITTPDGYKPNSEKSKYNNINILNYIDGIGGVYDATSSTHTELVATSKALEWIKDKEFKTVRIFTDSMNVINGLTKNAKKWAEEGWKKPCGTPRPNASLWKSTLNTYDDVSTKCKLSLEWVKGHAGDFGNEMVDSYAKRGNVLTLNGSEYKYMDELPGKGYWSQKSDYNRLLANARWYYSTLDLSQQTKDGKTIYHFGSHGKDDFDYGKATGDASMTVIFVDKPDPVLEIIRKRSYDMDKNKIGQIMIARLDTVLVPANYNEILKHNGEFLLGSNKLPGNKRIDILMHDKTPLVRQQTPPGLTFLACRKLNMLEQRLQDFLDKEPAITVTDITDKIYETVLVGKAKKPSVVIKPELGQSVKHMDIDANFCLLMGPDLKDQNKVKEATKSHKVRMLVNGDLPRRNVLSNIADESTRAYIITWYESDCAFRYASVVINKDGAGIWSNVDSNIQLVDPKKTKSLIGLDVSDWTKSLVEVDVSNWDASKVTNMGNMFRDCSESKNI